MKTRTGLLLIGAGAILAFAVTTNTSVFNLHTAGWVIMVVGLLWLAVPRRGWEWVGRRLLIVPAGQEGGRDRLPGLRAQPGHHPRPGRAAGPGRAARPGVRRPSGQAARGTRRRGGGRRGRLRGVTAAVTARPAPRDPQRP